MISLLFVAVGVVVDDAVFMFLLFSLPAVDDVAVDVVNGVSDGGGAVVFLLFSVATVQLYC